MGNRFPVMTGKDNYQYIDVGTNIDARAATAPEGRFDITLNLERSWVGGEGTMPSDRTTEASAMQGQPIVRQFKAEMNLIMHDGQTIQSTQATDPVSGRISTVTVTMTVVK